MGKITLTTKPEEHALLKKSAKTNKRSIAQHTLHLALGSSSIQKLLKAAQEESK